MIGNILKAIVAPVAGIFNKRTERKIIEAKLESGEILTREETMRTEAMMRSGSWKDEYVLLLISSPIVVMLIGIVETFIWGTTGLTVAGQAMIDEFNSIDQDSWYGVMLTAAFSVSLGIYGMVKFKNR